MPKVLRRKSCKVTKRRAKVRWKGSHYIPVAEQVRMCEDYLQGGPKNSIREIAKRFHRDDETVARVVKSETMEELGEKLFKSVLANTAEKIVERIDYEVATKSSKAGAYIAMDLAERIGAIPPKITRSLAAGMFGRVPIQPNGNGNGEKADDEGVSYWVKKLTEVTMERGKIFGMPMPELDELEKEDEVEIPLHRSTTNGHKKEKA